MKNRLHTVTVIMLVIVLVLITFIMDNFLVLMSEILLLVFSISIAGKSKSIARSFLIFLPFFVLNSLINIAFSNQGITVIFVVLGRGVTLETLLYSILFSLKLLAVVLSFSFLSIYLDSDSAISFFSSHMPKATFMLLIVFKLIPHMKNHLNNLKDIYAMRGVDFQSKTMRGRVKSSMPVIMVMLENSMEGAFDIGEAAYVRGFFSGKRSYYDTSRFRRLDAVSIIFTALLLCLGSLYSLHFSDGSYINYKDMLASFNVYSFIISLNVGVIAVILGGIALKKR